MDGNLSTNTKHERRVAKLWRVMRPRKSDPDVSAAYRLGALQRLLQYGEITSVEPFLPLFFTLRGKPYTLTDHSVFSPMFKLLIPKRSVYKTARQVGKSTDLASSSLILANCIPDFTNMFVCPLFEQTRRLSGNFIRPFIDQSPLRDLWTSTITEKSVLQKSFTNNSKLIFSFACLDADRTRGISGDKLSVDESLCYQTTYVKTTTGTKSLKDVKSGDFVLSFLPCGDILWDEVVKNSDHGYRACWKITTADGRQLAATADSWIATTEGWYRVAQIIQRTYERTTAAAPGDTAGGRTHQCKKSALSIQARLDPTPIQLDEVPSFIRIRFQASQEAEERRLREMVVCLDNINSTGIRVLTEPVLPQTPNREVQGRTTQADQNAQPVLAQTYRRSGILGNAGLVDRGRRITVRSAPYISHPRFHVRRCGTAARLAGRTRYCRQYQRDLEPQAQQNVLRPQAHSGRNPIRLRECRTAYAGLHGVQGYTVADVSPNGVLRMRFAHPNEEGALPREDGQAAHLLQPGMPPSGNHGDQAEVQRNTQETAAGSKPRTLLREPGRGTGQSTQKHREVSRDESRRAQPAKTGSTRQKDRSAQTSHRSLRTMPATLDTTTSEQPVLSNLQTDSCARDQDTLRLTSSEIVKIEYAGVRHVGDLETKNQHRFVANGIAVHNCQDMREEHIPVMREALAASPYAIEQYTGTPKSLSNFIEKLHMQSSQAEWFIKCTHCSFFNIPSREHHLEKMIGPMRDDISEARPGTICAKCRQPISPRFGFWKHRYPDRMYEFAGYHIPQIIMPLHYASPRKWAELCLKQRGGVQTSPATFWNEVMGESYDTGSRLLTLTELQAAACLPWENDYRDPDKVLREIKARNLKYKETILAIDWGGGGEERVSFTSIALLGYRGNGRIDVLWGNRLLTPNDHLEEAARVAYYVKKFRPTFIAHDATGAGKLRETILLQTGKIPQERVLAFELTGGGKALVKYAPSEPNRPRAVYRIDKTRTLQYTLASLRMQIIRTFKYDRKTDSDPGLLWDFLALIEEKVDTKYAGDMYSICREQGQSDDFAQAVNIGCVAFWHRHSDWPDLYKAAGTKKTAIAIADRLRNAVELTDAQLKAAGHADYGWEEADGDDY